MTTLSDRIRAAISAFKDPNVTIQQANPVQNIAPDNVTIDPMRCGLMDAVQTGWYNAKADELAKGFHIDSNDKVIDIGCGGGDAARFYLPRCEQAILLDMVFDTVNHAVKQPYAEGAASPMGVCGSVNGLPFQDGYADKVIMMEVLEHTFDPLAALKEIRRVGKDDALFLVTVPAAISERSQRDWAPDAYFQFPNHIQQFEVEDLQKLFDEAGFEIQSIQRWGFYWAVALLLHWMARIERGEDLNDTTAKDAVCPPFSPLFHQWAEFWYALIKSPERRQMAETLNNAFPRTINVIAKKKR